jgi:hypothetical protein
MPLKLGRVVGERVLTYGPKGRQRIIVRVGTPRKADPRTWQCAFQISGIRGSHVYAAYGVDALQALQLAFQGIRFYLARHRVRATWIGGEKGDPGFPEVVPSFSLAFDRRMSRIIAREAKLYVREVLKRRREARRREPTRKKPGKK